jgi:hypothetical protein
VLKEIGGSGRSGGKVGAGVKRSRSVVRDSLKADAVLEWIWGAVGRTAAVLEGDGGRMQSLSKWVKRRWCCRVCRIGEVDARGACVEGGGEAVGRW